MPTALIWKETEEQMWIIRTSGENEGFIKQECVKGDSLQRRQEYKREVLREMNALDNRAL